MNLSVGIIGLGYVGLPLAVAVGNKYPTLGFDINPKRIEELGQGHDRTHEVDESELNDSTFLRFTGDKDKLAKCNFFIITVPTPVNDAKQPNLSPIKAATKTVGENLSNGAIVVYESTVFPGCTEEVCVPILEKVSGLKYNQDFYCGYSPERINPGDKKHRITDIKKVTSGSNPEIAQKIDKFYNSFITAGSHLASSIKVAEAAKVIENAQRDINIAFVNELAVIFDKMGLDTLEVLETAKTKWNFLPFTPGLVGGHCISVDPYYLTHKAEQLGHHPQVFTVGRKINDGMGSHVANKVIKLLGAKGKLSSETRVAILGFTFKENCPDVRNTRVIDIFSELRSYNISIDVYDPQADTVEVENEYGISLLAELKPESYEAIIVAVAHDQFVSLDWKVIKKQVSVIYDVKGILDKDIIDARL
ncbi:MAG: nucleotide sugar dehydrogenase [Cytophagales bacterium]|nr:nucleotide sugar dehydrogenase [Cytophagales bacterium]